MLIDDLFESLCNTEDEKAISYGKELKATESQTKALVALSYIFPVRLTNAIDLIETGRCEVFTCGASKCILVDNYMVSLRLWGCHCNDYLGQLVSQPNTELRWKRICKHILAAFIVEKGYPILDYSVVERKEIAVSDMVELNLHGLKSGN